MWPCYGVLITVCMALLVFVLCQPLHSCIEPSQGLDFFLEIFSWRLYIYWKAPLGLRGEPRIMPELANKAFIQKSKPITFQMSRCACMHVLHLSVLALVFSDFLEIGVDLCQFYTHSPVRTQAQYLRRMRTEA